MNDSQCEVCKTGDEEEMKEYYVKTGDRLSIGEMKRCEKKNYLIDYSDAE